jgi:beta-lactamase class A
MSALEARLNAICDARPFTTSYHVHDLRAGETIGRAADVVVPSASTRKISIMMAAFRAAHAGRLDLAEKVATTTAMMKGVASGTFQLMQPGLLVPLRDAILQMIVLSDNVCTGIVTSRLSLTELNEFCALAGMTGTTHRFAVPPPDMPADHRLDEVTTTTPADQGRLLHAILRGADSVDRAAELGSTPEFCQLALTFLANQKFRTMIPSLLPADTRVAHKTGTGRRGRMDAGIVYRAGALLFTIAAYTDGVPTTMPDGLPGHAAAFATIGQLSRACWDHMA